MLRSVEGDESRGDKEGPGNLAGSLHGAVLARVDAVGSDPSQRYRIRGERNSEVGPRQLLQGPIRQLFSGKVRSEVSVESFEPVSLYMNRHLG